VPYFPWQGLKAIPLYHHQVMKQFYLHWWMRQYELARSHPLILLLVKTCIFWSFFLGPLLTIPLFVLSFSLPSGFSIRDLNQRTRFLLLISATMAFASLLPVYFNPHYVAAATCAFYALLLIAIQKIRKWKPQGKPAGIALIRYILVVTCLMFLIRLAAPAVKMSTTPTLATWYGPVICGSYRAGLISQLSGDRERHLVIVRYQSDHDPSDEWVYNAAQIDDAKIVWARDMGPQANLELIRYFNDRKMWIVEPDKLPPVLYPYRRDQVATKGNLPSTVFEPGGEH
jgi:signal transduction histidine kinase